MKKLRYFWKNNWYYIDLYKDNTAIKFKEYEARNKTSVFEFYTGLKDKNNVEIYNGDIFLFLNEIKNVVEFKYGTFGYNASKEQGFENFVNLSNSHFDWKEENRAYNIEVIGNIHQNPELL